MRGGVLPPALLFAALAFALAHAPRGVRLAAALAAFVTAVAQVAVAPRAVDLVLTGCWLSVIVISASIHLRRGVGTRLALALGVNAGVWAGATVAAAWLVASRRGIALKDAGNWLIAIAALAAVLPIVPTPGYAPDHME